MSKNLTHFEEIRKKRTRIRLLKKIFFILLLFGFLSIIYFVYKNNYHFKIVNNIKSMCKVFKRGNGYPAILNATFIKDKSKIGNGVLLLDENIIYIFNKFGYKMLYQKHGLNDPRVVSNRKKAVVFEHLGKNLKVYSKTMKLFEKELDNIIYNSQISDDGKIAIIKKSNRYLSSLEIWSDSYRPIFKWDSSDQYITSVSFSNNSKNFAVSSIETEGVDYISTITFFNINEDKKISQISIKDDVIISIKYKNNNIYVIGDKNAYIIDNKAGIKYKYHYNGKQLKAYSNDLVENVVLIFENYDRLTNNNLIILDNTFKEIGDQKIKGEIKDIDVINKNIFILIDEKIMKMNLSGKLVKIYDVDSVDNNIIATSDRLYKLNISKLDIVK